MLELSAVEALLYHTFVAEEALKALLAFACARRSVELAVSAAHHARVVIYIPAIHTRACGVVASLAIRAVQLAFFTLGSRPIFVRAVAFTLRLIPGSSVGASRVGARCTCGA